METLGRRLRAERERQNITLKSIADRTKIGVPLLEGLERDDVARWPSGIFRKSFIRAYAEAINLDPDPVVREFVLLYPEPVDPTGFSADPLPDGKRGRLWKMLAFRFWSASAGTPR